MKSLLGFSSRKLFLSILFFSLFLISSKVLHANESNVYVDRDVKNPHVLKRWAKKVNSKHSFSLFTHGKPGELLINNRWLNPIDIVKFLEKKINHLEVNHINMYGCEFGKGSKGRQAVIYIENALGITISASDDITGKDGDWELEVGKINTSVEVLNYSFNLQCAGVTGGIDLGDDFDGDGVCNEDDLDDDNDGILDADECSNSILYPNFTTFNDATDVIEGAFSNGVTLSGLRSSGTFVNLNSVNTEDLSSNPNITYGEANVQSLNIAVPSGNTSYTFTFSEPVTDLVLQIDGLDRRRLNITGTGVTSVTELSGSPQNAISGTQIYDASTNTIHTVSWNEEDNGSVQGTFVIEGTYSSIIFEYSDNASTFGDGHAFTFGLFDSCDKDRDGIINSLDLDSDGDGCPDALEAGVTPRADLMSGDLINGDGTTNTTTNNSNAQFIFVSPINDTNGDGLYDGADGTTLDGATEYVSTYSTAALDATMQDCPADTDGDGILDDEDVDDDNDGILDVDESGICNLLIPDTMTANHFFANGSGSWPGSNLINGLEFPSGVTVESVISPYPTRGQDIWHGQTRRANGILTATFSGTNEISGVYIWGADRDDIAGDAPFREFTLEVTHAGGVTNLGPFITEVKPSANVFDFGQSFTNVTSIRFNILNGWVDLGNNGIHVSSVGIDFQQEPQNGWNISNEEIRFADAVSCSGLSLDTDGDGIINSLDLDSDGDGCPDALEGNGGFTYANLEAGSALTITNVDADGVPIVANSGQADVSSTDATVQGVECDSCNSLSTLFTDTDGDGVGNDCDLDDDNDGILDTNECINTYTPLQFSGLSSTPQNYTINTASITQSTTGTVDNRVNDDGLLVLASNGAELSVTTSEPVNFLLTPDITGTAGFELGDTWTVSSTSGDFEVINPSSGLDIIADTGNSVTFAPNNTPGALDWSIEIKHVRDLNVRMDVGNPLSKLNVLVATCPDTDNDGIQNYLDTDSDGDNCPDVLEGDGGFTYANLESDSSLGDTVNTNGIPITATGGTTSGTEITGQADTSSTNALVQSTACTCNPISVLFTDTDGDNVGDDCDLDADNDGILDTDECTNTYVPLQFSGLSSTPQNYTINTASITQSTTGTVDNRVNDDGLLVLASNGAELSVTTSEPVNFLLTPDITGTAGFELGDTWTVSSTSGDFEIINPSSGLDIIADTGNSVTFAPNNTPGALDWSIEIKHVRDLNVRMDVGNPLSKLNVLVATCPDTDNDGIQNYLDTDSDGDNCPDALEGDGGFTYANLESDSSLGDTVNTNGIPITATGGTTSGTETTGQADTSSTNSAVQAAECDSCNSTSTLFVDTDGDGVGNDCDLDDDNDGILDTVECSETREVFISDPTGTVVDITLPQSPTGNSGVLEGYTYDSSPAGTNGSITYTGLGTVKQNPGTAGFTASPITNNYRNNNGLSNNGSLVFDIDNSDLTTLTNSIPKHSELLMIEINANVLTFTVKTTLVDGGLITNPADLSVSNTEGSVSTLSGPIDLGGGVFQYTLTEEVNNRTDNLIIAPVAEDLIEKIEITFTDVDLHDDWIKFTSRRYTIPDSDGDGIANCLDTDSDGDGCPDALEGNGGFTYANLESDSSLGDTVNTNGISITATGGTTSGTETTGQADTSSTNSAVQSAECDSCNASSTLFTDSDLDGVGDDCDLDDDNDGILDTVECPETTEDYATTEALSVNPDVNQEHNSGTVSSFSFGSLPAGNEGVFNYSNLRTVDDNSHSSSVAIGFRILTNNYRDTNNLTNNGQLILNIPNASQTNLTNAIPHRSEARIVDIDSEELTFQVKMTTLNEGLLTNVSQINLEKSDTSSTLNGPIDLGNGVFEYTLIGAFGRSEIITLKPTATDLIEQLEITFTDNTRSGDRFALQHYRYLIPDTDGDGIANCLDLDNDNDGCPDALEGSSSLVYSDLNSDGSINITANPVDTDSSSTTYGSPYSLNNSIGTSQDNTLQSAECDSCNSTSTLFVDTDGDGVGNDCDLDDDNDGILDTDEGLVCSNQIQNAELVDNVGWVSVTTDTTGRVGFDYNSGNDWYLFTDDAMGESTLTPTLLTPATTDQLMFDYAFNQYLNELTLEILINGVVYAEIYAEAGNGNSSDGDGSFCAQFTYLNGASGSNTVCTTPFNNWVPSTVTIDFPEIEVTDIQFRVDSSLSRTADFVIDNVILEGCQELDTDGDGISNHLDLDSDGDGCPDAIEASVTPRADLAAGDLVNGDGTTNTTTNEQKAQFVFVSPTNDANGDGLYDGADGVTLDGVTEYTSTYSTFALDSSVGNCTIDLTLTKTVNNVVNKIGETVVYTLTVNNTGDSDATGVAVTDVLPTGLTYISDNSASTSTTFTDSNSDSIPDVWTIGNLAAGSSINLEITVNTDTMSGPFNNISEIKQANEPDEDSTPNNGQ